MQLMQENHLENAPKNYKEDSQLSFKIRAVLDALRVSYQIIQDAHPMLNTVLQLRSKLPLERTLSSQWEFLGGEQLELRVELCNEQNWRVDQPSPQVLNLIKNANSSSMGVYYLHRDSNSIICFRIRLPFETSKRHLHSYLKEIYLEISLLFTRFVIAAKLVEAQSAPQGPPKRIGDILQRLRDLKEEFQFSRQQRKRSTNCYNLTNSHIKIVSQVLSLIGLCFGRLKIYAKQGRVDLARCHRVFGAVKKAVEQGFAKENERAERSIVRGIEIQQVFGEEVIDEGGFSKICRGFYKFNEVLTYNNSISLHHSIPGTNNSAAFQEEEKTRQQPKDAIKKILVRKLPKIGEDFSYSNELELLKFIRNLRNTHIAGYYLSCSHINPAFNQGIYMEYYQENLARKSHLYQKRELLRISRQILQGVFFLWQNRILHRDLKQMNILIDQMGNARIIDFGSASGFHGNGAGHFTAASNRLMATKGYFQPYSDIAIPAVTAKYTRDEFYQVETFDIYSFGQILCNLFALQLPKDGLVERELLYLSMKCKEINPEDRMMPIEALCFQREVIGLFLQEISLDEQGKSQEKEMKKQK